MKKNNIDKQTVFTPAFRRTCIGGCCLYMAAYLSVTGVLLAMGTEAWKAGLAFVAGMFVSGPFNAYLGDAYRRKHVFVVALLGMAVAIAGYIYWADAPLWPVLAAVQGMCFGLASAAGVTVSIDITVSGNRTRGNEMYALLGRIGMFTGMLLAFWLYRQEGLEEVLYLSLAFGLLGALEVARVYLPFRAPIGVGIVNLDRFLLPRALVSAFSVLLLAGACGMTIVRMQEALPWYACAGLCMLGLLFVAPLVKMFVKLSHHCQRGTGNTTFNLAADTGLVAGMALALWAGKGILTCGWLSGVWLLALLVAGLVAYPYYKKKRVR